MNKWIKPDKIMIILGTLITAANEYFGWTLDTANVGAFFFMLFTYFKQNEIIKVVRHSHGLPVHFKLNSTKFVFTVAGLLLMVADQAWNIGMGIEGVIAIAVFISGYNAYEGNEDLKKVEHESAGNHFH